MKVLMISAQDSAAITPTIKDVMAKGIKVVTLERSLPTPVTLHIGPHNKPIGELAGKFLVDKLGGKGNVVEIKGDPAVAPAIERHDGFADAIKGADIKVVAETHADWDQEKALKFMEDTLQRFPPGQIQAVYAHNDNMASAPCARSRRRAATRKASSSSASTARTRPSAPSPRATSRRPSLIRPSRRRGIAAHALAYERSLGAG